ncbi:MAG: Rieske 2Fe-2S domain-containing protein [Rhodoferax sp.]
MPEPEIWTTDAPGWIDLCASAALIDSGLAVPFDVRYWGRACRAFAVRYQGQVVAYLNQCSHVPMEMDYQPNQFFDTTGQWLICATHGAMYAPLTGRCAMGPCRGGLFKIAVIEAEGRVRWHTEPHLQPLFDS